MMRLSATYILGSIVLLNAAVAEELVYRDWRGSPDFVNGLFLGCHLVSPESWPEPERIEVAATDGLQFHIVYYAQYDTPPPVNKKLMVDVVLYDQENVFKSKSIWS